MARVIAMPRLGLKMTEGTVIEWRVAPGDLVLAGQIALVIESDKIDPRMWFGPWLSSSDT